MNALLFPGQGSQTVGMGLEFYNNFEIVKKIFKEADEKLNFKISKIILEGPDNELKLTQNTQPAILVVSYSIFSVLKNEFGFDLKSTKYFAGHSLGEYSALVCSESLKFNDALYLLYERGKSMQEAVPIGQGSMIAILGSKLDEINYFIKKTDSSGVCEIANDNAEGQIILSGDVESIDKLKNILKESKKKFIPLNVSAPFHCSLMNPAALKMNDKINSVNFQRPKFDIVSNVTSKPENNPGNIKKLLIKQICSTVRWRESILNMSKENITNFVEIGPGKVLSGMVKRTIKNINCFSINSIDDMKKTIDELKK
jgi:[acyl-carrier-protein] S-malonyltransferase